MKFLLIIYIATINAMPNQHTIQNLEIETNTTNQIIITTETNTTYTEIQTTWLCNHETGLPIHLRETSDQNKPTTTCQTSAAQITTTK